MRPATRASAACQHAPFPNPRGFAATFSTTGTIDLTNPFFKSSGSNGRACGSVPPTERGWTITPQQVSRVEPAGGRSHFPPSTAPIRRTSTSPRRGPARRVPRAPRQGPRSGRRRNPAGAEFELVGVDDPYGMRARRSFQPVPRPLPSTNCRLLLTVMWDGRETFLDAASPVCVLGTGNCFAAMHLRTSRTSRTRHHGSCPGRTDLSSRTAQRIVEFETSLFTPQIDDEAGEPDRGHAPGEARGAERPDIFRHQRRGLGRLSHRAGCSTRCVQAYERVGARQDGVEHQGRAQPRRAVARGERLFNSIRSDHGGQGAQRRSQVPVLQGTCTSCHDAPSAGDHSTPAPLDIGVADAARRTADMPLYTLRQQGLRRDIQTTDPGTRAHERTLDATSGGSKARSCVGRHARAVFHNGPAGNLNEVVEFYDQRFEIGLPKTTSATSWHSCARSSVNGVRRERRRAMPIPRADAWDRRRSAA